MTMDQREHVRRSVRQPARISLDGAAVSRDCLMIDVSASGACLVLDSAEPLPARFFLLLSRDVRRQCVLVWQTDAKAGVQFVLNEGA
jgi:hypothetical protein